MNLFALRATKPATMRADSAPIGPENDAHLMRVFREAHHAGLPIVAAWGDHGQHAKRDAEVKALAAMFGVTLQCLGITKGGHPRHPLYVRRDQPLADLPS